MEDPEALKEWQAYVETNLTAPFALSQARIPYLKEPNRGEVQHTTTQDHARPCIIHIGSFRALQSDPNQEGYASTKAGLLRLTQSMAISCKEWGIRVNLIAPGCIKVEYERKEGDEKGEDRKDTLDEDDFTQHPTNRPGMPEDIAGAVEYLMGAGFVTGQDITVDGGVTKRKNKS
jgi:NAD(P)-dependent dehydrogenase (short-subunit alcohol dehydrogenase family)